MDNNPAISDWRIARVSNKFFENDGLVMNVEVVLGNKHLDQKGIPMQPPTTLQCPMQKMVTQLSK